MIHRIKKVDDINKDKWIGVGGKFEEKESPFDCVKREMFEETGLTPQKLNYRGIVTFVSNEYGTEYMHLFTATGWTGTPRECDEGELAWIQKKTLLSLPMWEGDKIFFNLLEKEQGFFNLKLKYNKDKLIEYQIN